MLYDHQLYLKTVSEFARSLLTPYDVDAALEALADRVSDVLGLVGSGVSLAQDGRLTFGTAYGSNVDTVEQVQEITQSGPCVEAFSTGNVVAIADLSTEAHRWPEYCDAALQAGISSVASLPMTLGDRTVGALDLYDRGPREWSGESLAAAAVMADMATSYVINANHHRQQVELNRQLQEALESRLTIEQAKGMLAVRHELTLDQAFQRIRSHARRHRASVREVAEAVVRLGLDV